MNIIKIDKNNQVNGDGLRCVLWISGCENHCVGCHNPETWDYHIGHPMGINDYQIIKQQLSSPEISGITLTGGDPLAPLNRAETAELCAALKRDFPTKAIWVYTGHLFEDVRQYCLSIDVLIDGKYIPELNPGIGKVLWRGSTNQRIIDAQESLIQNKVVLYKN